MRIFALDRSFYKLYRQDIAQLGPEASERLRLVQGFERLRRRGISGEEAAEIRDTESLDLYPLSLSRSEVAADVAARIGVRGADAVYLALASELGEALMTLDRQQLERGKRVTGVWRPA